MDLEQLSTVVALLVALSVAAERLVDIIKNMVGFLRDEHKEDPKKEGRRKAALQVLAVAAGILTAFLARPAIEGIVPGAWSSSTGIIALGLLASGGSGFWNSVATYVLNLKDIKAAVAEKEQAVAEKEQAVAEVAKREAKQEIQILEGASERR